MAKPKKPVIPSAKSQPKLARPKAGSAAAPAKKTVTIRELIGNAATTLRTKGIEAAVAEVKALAAKSHPEVSLADRLILLASALVQQSPKQALDVCEYLIKTETEPPIDAYVIAGGVQDRLGDRKASEVSMTAVIDSPRSTPAQKLKAANLLVRFGKQEVALKAAREAFNAMGKPLEHVPTILYISQVTAEFDLTDQLTNQLREAYAQGKGDLANESPRTNLLWCEDEAINIQVVKNWSAKALPSVKTEPLPPLEPLQGRRIRVGYLSSDFREHPTSRLINGLLRNHDHSKFEIFMYCSGWDDGSPMRKEVESHCDQVHSVAKLSDQEAAALIRSHRIDVLVELNGPTRANRMGILAYRPAPVQIDYLGWPGSVGGRVVDYVVGDDITLPKALEHTYPEKIIRLSKVYQINDYAARTLPPKPTRKEVGLPEGDFLVLGMFNAINKVHNQAWAVWMKIMQAVPNTILWILDPGPLARKHLAVAAKRYGVDIKRIIGAPRLPEQLHIARLQHCDLMLDPWPYGGHTSTADALFAGVPVVALMGKNFAGRVSAALLHAAGLKGLVASDLQDYVNRLVHLLKNPGELERAKAFVKEKVPTSDVFNARDKARQMEEAYEGALRECVSTLASSATIFDEKRLQQLRPLSEANYQSEQPEVSVLITTYNHEKFIHECLDAVLMQKVDFAVDVIVVDDASTDNTQNILSSYAKRYPAVIKLILRTENYYSQGKKSAGELLKITKGKYIARCDGDDYWSDDLKLVKQKIFLDNNPKYVLSYHLEELINEDGEKIGQSLLPLAAQRDYTQLELRLLKWGWMLLGTIMHRNALTEYPSEYSLTPNGDNFLPVLLGQFGGAKLQREIKPLKYRQHSGGIWSLKTREQKFWMHMQTYLQIAAYLVRVGERQNALLYLQSRVLPQANKLLSMNMEARG